MTSTTAYDDFQTIVCSCGTSFHDNTAQATARHELRHHAAGDQVTYAVFAAASQEFSGVLQRVAE